MAKVAKVAVPSWSCATESEANQVCTGRRSPGVESPTKQTSLIHFAMEWLGTGKEIGLQHA